MKLTLWYEEPCGVRHFVTETKDLNMIDYYIEHCPNEYSPIIVLDDGASCIAAKPIKQK